MTNRSLYHVHLFYQYLPHSYLICHLIEMLLDFRATRPIDDSSSLSLLGSQVLKGLICETGIMFGNVKVIEISIK